MVSQSETHYLLTADDLPQDAPGGHLLTVSLAELPASSAVSSEQQASPAELQTPGSLRDIRQAARQVYRVLDRARHHGGGTAGDLKDLQAAGQALSAALFPVEIAQQLGTAASLRLRLPRELLWIPWELATLDGEYLALRLPVGRQIDSLPLPPLAAPRRRAELQIVLVANPQFNLKEADREADELRQRLARLPDLPAPHIAAHEVSREQFRQALVQGDWLHYAGHAESPAEAAARLLLFDGPLEPGDLPALLAERAPALVMANACESARLSEAQCDRPGLAEAFLAAGAAHYIGTLAPVLDEAGLKFVVHFYEELLAGAAVGAALLAARSASVEAAGKAALIWASYVLYGDPQAQLVEPPSADEAAGEEAAGDDLWRKREKLQSRADVEEFQAHLEHEAEVKELLRQEELRDYQSAAEARQWDRRAQESAKEQAYRQQRQAAELEGARQRLDHELEEAARWGQLGLELEARHDRQRLELESRRLEALSNASLEALMAAAGADRRAAILGELAKTRALAGRPLVEVLALADERSPLVAEAIRERLQSESQPRRIEEQRLLGDQILEAQVEPDSSPPPSDNEQLYRLLGEAVLPGVPAGDAPPAEAAGEPRSCPHCETALPAEAKFCTHCGHRLG